MRVGKERMSDGDVFVSEEYEGNRLWARKRSIKSFLTGPAFGIARMVGEGHGMEFRICMIFTTA